MKQELEEGKIFTQYRGNMNPYGPVKGRKYTVTHSDTTAELYVFIAREFAEDQITQMRDEVRLFWDKERGILSLGGMVLVDDCKLRESAAIRNKIFYNEMPKALQALRQADRFIFEQYRFLDRAQVTIHFISTIPEYDRLYHFGCIGDYR